MDCNNIIPSQCRLCAFQNALKIFAERTDKLFVFQNYPFPRKRWLERSSGSQTFLLEPDAFEKSELIYDPIILCNLVSLLPGEAAKLDDWMREIYQAAEGWLRRTARTEQLEKCREIRIDVLAVEHRKYRDEHNLENEVDERMQLAPLNIIRCGLRREKVIKLLFQHGKDTNNELTDEILGMVTELAQELAGYGCYRVLSSTSSPRAEKAECVSKAEGIPGGHP
jgi:hypothetical protein